MAYDYEQIERLQALRNTDRSEQLALEIRQRGIECWAVTDDAYYVSISGRGQIVYSEQLEAIYERVKNIYPDTDIN